MDQGIKKREAIVNKIRRFPLIVFLRRILPFIIFLIIIIFSFIFGLWSVREFDYKGSTLINVKEVELDRYLSEYIGKNIFSLSLSDVESHLLDSNGYIKEVYIKKILPSKLDIVVNELEPLYLGYSGNRCLIFADTGELISEICEECENECIERKGEGLIYLESESSLDSDGRLIFYNEVNGIQRVLSEFEYEINGIKISNGLATVTDMDGHTFVFDITYDFETQLARVYIVCQKINEDVIKFKSLDLRFDRPVMRLE